MTPPEPQSESILYVISEMQTQLKRRAERIRELEEHVARLDANTAGAIDMINLLRTRERLLQDVVNDLAVTQWSPKFFGDDPDYEGTINADLLKKARSLYSTEQ